MPKRSTCPRLLSDVLQAIADAGGAQGCTIKRILKQVEASILLKNIKPKPRNLVTQVRRAVTHGIDKGLLTQKYGKIFLILGQKRSCTNRTVPNKRTKGPHERLCNGPPKNIPRRKREDTPSSKNSTYFPSSCARSRISTDQDSCSDRRLKRHRKKKTGPRKSRTAQLCRGGSQCSSRSRRTSKNNVLPQDDEVNDVNVANEENPDFLYNPDEM